MHPIHVSVFLCNAFSNMVLACLLEPLRVVRDQTGAGNTMLKILICEATSDWTSIVTF
jgi:hypothetical protein